MALESYKTLAASHSIATALFASLSPVRPKVLLIIPMPSRVSSVFLTARVGLSVRIYSMNNMAFLERSRKSRLLSRAASVLVQEDSLLG